MLPEQTAPRSRYLLREALLLWVAVPVVAQVFLVAATALATAVDPGNPVGWGLSGLVVALGGGLVGHWQGRHADLPADWARRYGPLFATITLLCGLWALDMHLSGGDFSRSGVPPATYFLYLPWLLLLLMSAFGGKWLLVTVPVLAYAGYAGALWWAGRSRPVTRTRAWLPAGSVLAGLMVLIGWQFQQRLEAMPPLGLKGERIDEELALHEYRPFLPGNRLAAVAPASVRFQPADAPRLDGATAAYPLYAAVAQAFYTPEAAQAAVAVSRTAQAYERLIKGEADAIFVAQASQAHEQLAREKGVTLQFTPIGREAFVFLVNEANPVRSLTPAQIRGIYAGRIMAWREVGGSADRVLAFQRPANSGSQTVMLARVMQGEAMRKPMEEELAQGMGGLVREVAAYRNAPQSLGYSFRYYATRMQRPQAVRLLAIDGIAPTADNVRSGAYPYVVHLHMVTTDKSRPSTAQLREWLLGPQGQQLVEDAGYVAR